MPAAPYVWVGLAPVPVVVSPKSQAYEAMVPSGSLDVEVNRPVWYVLTLVNAAVGAMFGGGSTTVTGSVTTLVPPRSSVTVSVTLYVPAVA